MTDTAWLDRARCVGADTEMFFDKSRIEEAQAVCAACPVVAACAKHREETGSTLGVWGGEWFKIKNPGPSALSEMKQIDHGSDRGYKMHLRRGVKVCHQCLLAHNRANRRRERKQVSA